MHPWRLVALSLTIITCRAALVSLEPRLNTMDDDLRTLLTSRSHWLSSPEHGSIVPRNLLPSTIDTSLHTVEPNLRARSLSSPRDRRNYWNARTSERFQSLAKGAGSAVKHAAGACFGCARESASRVNDGLETTGTAIKDAGKKAGTVAKSASKAMLSGGSVGAQTLPQVDPLLSAFGTGSRHPVVSSSRERKQDHGSP